jgi:hypothetical protein
LYEIIFGNTKLILINPLNAELNPICHLLALLGTHHILHVSRIRVKETIHYPQSFPEQKEFSVSLTFHIPPYNSPEKFWHKVQKPFKR